MIDTCSGESESAARPTGESIEVPLDSFWSPLYAPFANAPADLLSLAGADLDNPCTIAALVARLESLVGELERAVNGANTRDPDPKEHR